MVERASQQPVKPVHRFGATVVGEIQRDRVVDHHRRLAARMRRDGLKRMLRQVGMSDVDIADPLGQGAQQAGEVLAKALDRRQPPEVALHLPLHRGQF